jgi:hypothetical protein
LFPAARRPECPGSRDVGPRMLEGAWKR